jgi:hypothetical protein
LVNSPTDPAWTLTLHAVGDKFSYNGAHYVVKGIDLPARSVIFDKSFALNPKKPKKLILDPQTLTVPAPVAPAPKAKPATPAATKSVTPKK